MASNNPIKIGLLERFLLARKKKRIHSEAMNATVGHSHDSWIRGNAIDTHMGNEGYEPVAGASDLDKQSPSTYLVKKFR